ncbi:8-amino-7-oxononanoate synthase [Galenea microaerophila]
MGKQTLAQRFAPRLQQRQEEALYRRRPLVFSPQQPAMQINGLPVVNFSSNDYLGLANHPEIKRRLAENLDAISVGSGAAHLVTGHHLHHHLLEDELADWLGVERVLLFSTGYMANLAVLETLMQKGDLLLADKLNHASLIDGALHSAATLKRYPHNDMNALAKRLAQASEQQQTLIATDGVFSMDGDLAPLDKLQALARQSQSWLYVDDAHGLGVLGEQGRGSFSHFRVPIDDDTILMGTLGKAFGVSGAFVAGSEVLIETLIQFARPYIYTTAMSPLMALAARTALKLVKAADAERAQLQQNIQQFKTGCQQRQLNLLPSETAIQPILLGDSQTALHWSDQLKQAGFWVTAIRPPTVPQGTARLRVTLSAAHTAQQIERLLDALMQLKQAPGAP